MASPERKIEELNSGKIAVLSTALQDEEFRRALDEWKIENSASWDTLLDGFEDGKYSDRREFKVTQLLENLMEQSSPDAERLIGALANVIGGKYTDLKNRLLDIKARLAHVGALSAFLPEPPGPSRTQRHYRRALTAQEKNDLAMPAGDNFKVGPGD